jgi:hypothetical protein
MKEVAPHLDTLPLAQRKLWPKLSAVGRDYILYGGTSLSLQVGGRVSIDFDLFTPDTLSLEELRNRFDFLARARLRRSAANTAIFAIGEGSESIAISFFGGLSFGRVGEPIRFSDNGVIGAALIDLAAQKIKVIQQRAEAKDYLDIHRLLSCGVSLPNMLGAAVALFPEVNPAISLKALSYFEDVGMVPESVQRDLINAAAAVRDIPRVPILAESILPIGGTP